MADDRLGDVEVAGQPLGGTPLGTEEIADHIEAWLRARAPLALS